MAHRIIRQSLKAHRKGSIKRKKPVHIMEAKNTHGWVKINRHSRSTADSISVGNGRHLIKLSVPTKRKHIIRALKRPIFPPNPGDIGVFPPIPDGKNGKKGKKKK